MGRRKNRKDFRYLDVKYEYLSYCLKIKELDDEEQEYHTVDEGLYRVETGNYEYRLMLRCRQEARQRFVQMRNDVMVKIELLDQKHGSYCFLNLIQMSFSAGHRHPADKPCQRDEVLPNGLHRHPPEDSQHSH